MRIWDVERGRELLTLRGPNDRVHSVAFSPDGASLVAGSADGLIRVWQSQPDPKMTRFEDNARESASN